MKAAEGKTRRRLHRRKPFGGGIVPALNTLAHTPVEAPECQALESYDFIAPGATYQSDTEEEQGDEKYQCCIHPWMRLTAHVREK